MHRPGSVSTDWQPNSAKQAQHMIDTSTRSWRPSLPTLHRGLRNATHQSARVGLEPGAAAARCKRTTTSNQCKLDSKIVTITLLLPRLQPVLRLFVEPSQTLDRSTDRQTVVSGGTLRVTHKIVNKKTLTGPLFALRTRADAGRRVRAVRKRAPASRRRRFEEAWCGGLVVA